MRLQLLVAVALLVFPARLGDKNKEEVRLVFGGSEEAPASKDSIEFLEDTAGQGYLDVITYRDRFVLDLLKFSDQIRDSKIDTNPENAYLCPRQLLENFGLRGLTTPVVTPVPPRYCPAMKQSCCLPNDVEDLEAIWRDRYAPKIKYVQHYVKFYLKDILGHFADYVRVAGEVARDHKKQFCRDAANRVLDFKMEEGFARTFLEAADRFFDFDYRLKRGFICLLCDYENLGGLDFDGQMNSFNRDFCGSLVSGTFEFQHTAHRVVYRLVNTVSVLANCQKTMSANATLEASAPPFLDVETGQTMEVCDYARQNGFNIFVNCLNYCSNYRIWRPEFPTYPSVNTLAKIHQLAKDYLFADREALVVSPPREAEMGEIVPSKRDRLDLLTSWEVVFTDTAGVRFSHFTDPQTADF